MLLISFICILNVSAIDCDPWKNYPPINQPGPSYTVPRRNLSDHFKCYSGKNHRKRWILFLPGSTEEVHELYSWNWMQVMNEKQWPYCTLQLPEKGLGDLQIAAEYIVYAVRKMYKKNNERKRKRYSSKNKN
jgi:hypothetical protein